MGLLLVVIAMSSPWSWVSISNTQTPLKNRSYLRFFFAITLNTIICTDKTLGLTSFNNTQHALIRTYSQLKNMGTHNKEAEPHDHLRNKRTSFRHHHIH